MPRPLKNFASLLVCITFLWGFPLHAAFAASPAAMKAVKTAAKTPEEAPLPENSLDKLTDKEIDALLGRLIEARARHADATSAPVPVKSPEKTASKRRLLVRMFLHAERSLSHLNSRIDAAINDALKSPNEISRVAARLSGGQGARAILRMALGVIFLILFGAAIEWLFRRWTAELRRTMVNIPPSDHVRKIWGIILNLSLDTAGALVYLISTFIMFVLFFEKHGAAYLFTACYLVGSYYVRLIILFMTLIFSPHNPILRFFPINDTGSRYLFRWTVSISVVAIFLGATSSMVNLIDDRTHLHLVLYNLSGLSVIFLVAVMVIQSRTQLAGALRKRYFSPDQHADPLWETLISLWYIPGFVYLVCIAVFWELGILSDSENLVTRLVLSFLSIPVFLTIDFGCQMLFRMAFKKLAKSMDAGELRTTENSEGAAALSPAAERPAGKSAAVGRYMPLVQKGFHVLIAFLLLFLMLRLWGIETPIGMAVTETLFNVLLILLIGYVTWELAKAAIDQKIKEEMPHDEEEDEEGGAGGSRSRTLLLLLRKFTFSVLIVIVGLTVLASLGINIGPLIAGAGIFGLAIGFGAQTLVKDIISGIFFLIDDAFRIGDYVESGSMKGKVEQISLRSLRLRHPRGMIHTIPFGDLNSVTNFSRDYIITKLSFRVRYDTDVNKVRKIIKKINDEISQDPEMGGALLSKIKSQGVKSLDDSAMVMRVKFKSIPGEQFIIQREVYRLLQEKFHEEGIEFAHRNVTVYFPPAMNQDAPTPPEAADHRSGGPDAKLALAGGAAAMKMIEEEEEAQKAAEEEEEKQKGQ